MLSLQKLSRSKSSFRVSFEFSESRCVRQAVSRNVLWENMKSMRRVEEESFFTILLRTRLSVTEWLKKESVERTPAPAVVVSVSSGSSSSEHNMTVQVVCFKRRLRYLWTNVNILTKFPMISVSVLDAGRRLTILMQKEDSQLWPCCSHCQLHKLYRGNNITFIMNSIMTCLTLIVILYSIASFAGEFTHFMLTQDCIYCVRHENESHSSS